MNLSQRVLGAVDLAIEFATLGEYGLEVVDTVHCRRERSGATASLAQPRRGCDAPMFKACSPERRRAAALS